MTTTEILTGIKNWVTGKLTLKQDVINDLASIRSGAQAGSTSVQPADIVSYFDDAVYDSGTHRINFYHGQSVIAYIDASPFIIDGMVDDVRIENGYLVVDFNTASGKQDISIPLTEIFDPSNYYNKAQTNTLLGNKVDKVQGKGLSTNDYTNAEKEKLSGLQNYDDTQVRQLIGQKQDIIQDLDTIRSGASAGATAVQPATLNSALSDTVAESGVYDVTANNDNAKFASLSALLSSENLDTLIPSAKRKGGMSIKFVQSSDNKYVQCRLMNNSWSIDTNDWAIAEEGVYVENPEFVYVKTDAEGKILWAIKIDGGIYYGAGVPQQVIDYINGKIAELSLDEYEDMVAFLNDLEKGDKTLQDLLDEKVDKVEGQSLIDAEYAAGIHYVENPEFVRVVTDNEDRILYAVKADGDFYFGAGVPQQIIDYVIEHTNATKEELLTLIDTKVDKEEGKSIIDAEFAGGISYVENLEFAGVWLDAEDKILFGVQTDGNFFFGCGVPRQVREYIEQKIEELPLDEYESIVTFIGEYLNNTTLEELLSKKVDGEYVDNPEFIEVKVDSEDKILEGIKKDGTKVLPVGIETPNVNAENISAKEVNIEGGEATLEKATLNSLELTNEGMTEFQQALKDAGFQPNAKYDDFSDSDFVEIPMPTSCAFVNIGVDSQAEAKGLDIETTLEFYWGGYYFKKPIILNAQGDSSLNYWIKNQGFDINDGSKIKFGSWVAQDSFHVKKYYIDVFRGQCIVGYWLTEQVYQTRPYGERRPWDYLNDGATTTNGIGKFKQDFDTGALAHPDGFPVHVFFNGKDAGIYSFNLKKHRDNYYMKKDSAKNIILDGRLGAAEIFQGTINWTAFEIRNPKSLKTVNGGKYDGDNPTEITGDPSVDATTAQVKGYIERLSGAYAAINANKTKATFEEYFLPDFFIDYFLISNAVWHQDGFMKNWIWCTWDGNKWAPTIYDLDSIFGMFWTGVRVVPAGEYRTPKASVEAWTNTNTLLGPILHVVGQLWDLYKEDIRSRYKELRDNGILTTDNIVSLLEKWLNKVGYDNLKNDIENVCAYNNVPQTPSYRDGSLNYEKYPTTGGFYNSILRVRRWLDEHFAYLDSVNIFNYNQN